MRIFHQTLILMSFVAVVKVHFHAVGQLDKNNGALQTSSRLPPTRPLRQVELWFSLSVIALTMHSCPAFWNYSDICALPLCGQLGIMLRNAETMFSCPELHSVTPGEVKELVWIKNTESCLNTMHKLWERELFFLFQIAPSTWSQCDICSW